MRELVKPLNFVDKLLRLLETAQNNCRTRWRYVREKDGQEERRRGGRERERSAKSRGQGCEEKAEGKTSLTIYYVGCQLGTGCPRNEFIKYFIRAGSRESRSDAGIEGWGWSGGRYQSKRERSCTKGHPFYNSPLRNNPLRDTTENARVTPTWLRVQTLRARPASHSSPLLPTPWLSRRLHSEFNKRYVQLRYFSGYRIGR